LLKCNINKRKWNGGKEYLLNSKLLILFTNGEFCLCYI